MILCIVLFTRSERSNKALYNILQLQRRNQQLLIMLRLNFITSFILHVIEEKQMKNFFNLICVQETQAENFYLIISFF